MGKSINKKKKDLSDFINTTLVYSSNKKQILKPF